MFGLLRIGKGRLGEADDEIYRGHFCGSCHAMREFGGRLSSFLTNYDQTVLSLVLGGLEGARIEARGCTAMPLRRVPVACLSAPAQSYVAAVNVALIDAKLRDDVADEPRWRSRVGAAALRGGARRAQARLRDLGFDPLPLAGLPAAQLAVESSRCPTLDSLAAPTAAVMEQVFRGAARVSGRAEFGDSLGQFGAALGRFVYVYDAWLDRDRDRQRGCFNAVDRCFVGRDPAAAVSAVLLDALAAMRTALRAGWIGDRGGVMAELLGTMRSRVLHRVGVPHAEAGFCDACEGCACCCEGSGGGAEGCCAACDCADCACCTCDHTCCGRKANREARRKTRLERVAGGE